MATELSRDLPAVRTRAGYDTIDDIFKSLDDNIANKLPDYVEFVGGYNKSAKALRILDDADAIYHSTNAEDSIKMLDNLGFKPDDLFDVPNKIEKARAYHTKTQRLMTKRGNKLLEGLDAIQAQKLLNADKRVVLLMGKGLEKEMSRFLPLEELKGPFGYYPRIGTRKFRKWVQNNKGKVVHHKGNTFSVKHGSQVARDEYLRNLTRGEIQELFEKSGFKGNVFENPAAALAERAAKTEKVAGTADTVYEAIRRFSNTSGEGRAVSELFKDLKWKVPDSKAIELGRKSFNDLFIDEDIFRALTNQYKIASDSSLDDIFKKVNSIYKTFLTVGFPAYHVRNSLSNVALNFMAGVQNPNSYVKAMRLQNSARQTRKIMKKSNIDFFEAAKQVKWPKIKTAAGMMDGQVFYRLMDKHNLLGQVAGHFAKEETPFLRFAGSKFGKKIGRKSGPYDKLYAVGQTVENNARLAHVIEKTQGMGIDDAVRSSKKALFDYGDLSEFEKTWLRDRVYLFYTFNRKNMAAQSRYLLSEPAKMAIFAKLAGGTPKAPQRLARPKYMQERVDIPTPLEDEEGRTINVRGLGLPIEEAFGPISAPGAGLFDRASRFVSRQLSRTSPYIKSTIELATKKNLYFDEDIRSKKEAAWQATPFSRVINTIQRFGRDDGTDTKVTDIATGVKAGPAYEDYYKYLSEKETIESKLRHDPSVKRFTRYYPRDKEKITPGTQSLLDRLYKRPKTQ